MKAFCNWMVKEGHTNTLVKISRLREERSVLQTFSDAQIAKLVSLRAKAFGEQRTHVLIGLILDKEIRNEEAGESPNCS